MIAHDHDIKFACSQCGQRIVVEKSAAGLAANCPVCDNSVTVPQASSIRERSTARFGFEPRFDEENIDELDIAAPLESAQQRLVTELAATREKLEHTETLLKKSVDECERMAANATHAQAEIKSVRSDRQQLKAELSAAKQRAQVAESRAAELVETLGAAEAEIASQREQFQNAQAISQERLAATETQLDARERELLLARTTNADQAEALAGLEADLAGDRAELAGLRAEFESAQLLLNEAAAAEERAAGELREVQAQLSAASAENERLSAHRDELSEQASVLRRDLVQTDSGRELLGMREQLARLAAEHETLRAALNQRTDEVETLSDKELALRMKLLESRRQCEEAERLAAANSEAQLRTDNEVLRGIIARQNADLGVRQAEVRRLRRARFGTRAISALFAVSLLGVALFALSVFTNRSIEEIFRQVLR